MQRDDEAAVAGQRHGADLDHAIGGGRRERGAGRSGFPELAGAQPGIASEELVQPGALAAVAGQRGEARVGELDARPAVVEAHDRRGHGAVLEREAAQVAGGWRQRGHGYVNERAVIERAAGMTCSAKRCTISRYSCIVPERTSKCIVRCE